ncbi:MAG: glycosyltransferase family 2 protein [Candidatus Obscuribacterales bacterium]|nr:glycosyltransferase family 2 protein [Cyanobacteria bacterium SZAS LIN-5]
MASLSVVIVAQDESRTIARVLQAVRGLADEILLVDSGSTDGTPEIATENGARVVHQDWLGYAAQKNFAIDMAVCDWILSLDADEIVSPELRTDIASKLSDPHIEDYDGYRIPRVLYIGDTPVRHGGFYPDAQLRLFKRGKGRFNDRLVHEAIKVSGPVCMLKHDLLHYAYPDVSGFAAAMEKYAQLSAAEYKRSGKARWKGHPFNELVHPAWTFFYRYFMRCGFLDGDLGWRLNAIYSDYVRNKIRYTRSS